MEQTPLLEDNLQPRFLQEDLRVGPWGTYWLQKAPRLLKVIFYSGPYLTTLQMDMWAILVGILIGLVTTGYQLLLDYLLDLVWHTIPESLEPHLFSDSFPKYNYTWMVSITLGTSAGLSLYLFNKYLNGPGTIPDLIDSIHKKGYVTEKFVIPMLVSSTLAIIGGASAGPEAAVIVMMGSISGGIAHRLTKSTLARRVLTLSGMSAGLASFFGLPLGGAIFVLEVPHRLGLQFFEALTPAVISSLVSVLVNKAITQKPLGGSMQFPPLERLSAYTLVQGVAVGIIGAFFATIFAVVVIVLKKLKKKYCHWLNPILAGLIGGTIIGIMGAICPYSLFWSEKELPTLLTGGITPLPNAITPGILHMGPRLTTTDYVIIVGVKFFTIIVTLLSEFPGGIIFPLFYCGAGIGHILSNVYGYDASLRPYGFHLTSCMLNMMGALEAAITRTPWGTALILLQIQEPTNAEDHFMSDFSVLSMSVWISVIITRSVRFYRPQIPRNDIKLRDVAVDVPESSEAEKDFYGIMPLTSRFAYSYTHSSFDDESASAASSIQDEDEEEQQLRPRGFLETESDDEYSDNDEPYIIRDPLTQKRYRRKIHRVVGQNKKNTKEI